MKRARVITRADWTRRGFTLTELMIAVAIIAILAAFLAPSVTTYVRRSKGQSAARDVSGTLRRARNEAMSRGQVVLVEVEQAHDNVQGIIRTYRTQGTESKCDPTNANYDPRDTDCFAMSCAQAQGFNAVEIDSARVDFSQTSPDMEISGVDPNSALTNNVLTLCFAPGGRVLTTAGTTYNSACDAVNTRIFVRSADVDDNTNPLGSSEKDLDACVDSATDDEAKRQAQKDGRDLANFYSIHVPYNGAVSVIQ